MVARILIASATLFALTAAVSFGVTAGIKGQALFSDYSAVDLNPRNAVVPDNKN